MKSSYSTRDVEILLKDLSGQIEPLPASEREKRIQTGTHYSEMLPLEYKPSDKYMNAYYSALENYGALTAEAVSVLAEKIYALKGKDVVIVSLARAGIPIGVLLKRYLFNKYDIDAKHYAISIIRGKGIDVNAVQYILNRHSAQSIQFIDGWIGKGAILGQLEEALKPFPQISNNLGVVSDPANLTELCGTHEDILIPSSCLNATVTGLISRTILRSDLISSKDFHGAVYYSELQNEDLSLAFIEKIEQNFNYSCTIDKSMTRLCEYGKDVVNSIRREYNITDINFIKPGIGEATRVLLRRIPWKIIVNQNYFNAKELLHVRQLAIEKQIPYEISRVPLGNYKVCGIIKYLADA